MALSETSCVVSNLELGTLSWLLGEFRSLGQFRPRDADAFWVQYRSAQASLREPRSQQNSHLTDLPLFHPPLAGLFPEAPADPCQASGMPLACGAGGINKRSKRAVLDTHDGGLSHCRISDQVAPT